MKGHHENINDLRHAINLVVKDEGFSSDIKVEENLEKSDNIFVIPKAKEVKTVSIKKKIIIN